MTVDKSQTLLVTPGNPFLTLDLTQRGLYREMTPPLTQGLESFGLNQPNDSTEPVSWSSHTKITHRPDSWCDSGGFRAI
jgi:hypothetical protein